MAPVFVSMLQVRTQITPYDENLPAWALRVPAADDDRLVAVIVLSLSQPLEAGQPMPGETLDVLLGPGFGAEDDLDALLAQVSELVQGYFADPASRRLWTLESAGTGVQLSLLRATE